VRLGSKWYVLLVYALLDGSHRPADLCRRFPGISQKVLTTQLRSMENDGLVERAVLMADSPQHIEDRLTTHSPTLDHPWPPSAPRPPTTQPRTLPHNPRAPSTGTKRSRVLAAPRSRAFAPGELQRAVRRSPGGNDHLFANCRDGITKLKN
jgi:hypothetical protein